MTGPSSGWGAPEEDAPQGIHDLLRGLVERHFRIYDEKEETIQGEVAAHLFYVMFPQEEFEERYEAIRQEVRTLDKDLLVFLRRDGGEDILFIAPRPSVKPTATRVNVVLMGLTLITTAMAGAMFWEGFARPDSAFEWRIFWDPGNLLWGALTFAVPLMLILGVHETAHFLTARRHGLRATLPYFIPVPPMLMPIGTFGAFIRLQDPLPDRKALFDVGASGPLAGFAVAVPLLLLGGFLTADADVGVPDLDRPEVDAEAFVVDASEEGRTLLTLDPVEAGTHLFRFTSPEDDWTVTLAATVTTEDGTRTETQTLTLADGETRLHTLHVPEGATAASVEITWDDGLLEFGDPLLVQALEPLWDNEERLSHPTFLAAWVGLLVTGINLLPAGQLDGGHVARAVLGEKVRWAALASLAVLMFLAFQFSAWILMALFLILTGLYHPPPLNDRTPLDARRKAVAALVLLVFAVTFIPVPVHF